MTHLFVAWLFGHLAAHGPTAELDIRSFGGVADGVTNNQKAIQKAMAVCDQSGGCTLSFPAGNATATNNGDRAGSAPEPYHPYGPVVVATYLTSAFNLTSNLRLVIPAGVQLRATESWDHNCGGASRETCDGLDSPGWPVLPNPSYPAFPSRPGDGVMLAKQAFIRGFNLTNVELTGGGEIDGGGGWWWCVRMAAAVPPQPAGGHSPKWCPAMLKAGKIPAFTLAPPRFLHMVEVDGFLLDNLTISNSPFWTLHFQYSNNVVVRHTTVFNPNNGSIEAPNGDGIDVDSSSNVHVHDSLFDVADDALCCKSGADWLGRAVDRPSENVLFENVEVRNGHGLTIGSEASGGMRNITFSGIFLNGLGGPQAPGRRRGGGVGGIHFKTGRGRGGIWKDIVWKNIFGSHAANLFGFSMNHGTGYNQALGPTNYSGTPIIKNLLIEDVVLTDVCGPSTLFSLAEAPIENFTLSNVTWSGAESTPGHPGPYECTGWSANRTVRGMFARGKAVGLTPPLPAECQFLPPLPPPAYRPQPKTDLGCHTGTADGHAMVAWCTNLARGPSPDEETCGKRCIADANAGGLCTSWSYNHAEKLCYLNNGHGRAFPSEDTSGQLYPNHY